MRINAIIISDSKSKPLFDMTQNAIDTLHKSEDKSKIEFVVTVVESCDRIAAQDWRGVTRFLKPNVPFNYNKFCNFGLNFCEEEWVAVCNNDLIFHAGWMSAILDLAVRLPETVQSFSPWNPDPWIHGDCDHVRGYGVGGIVTGWCLVAPAELFRRMRFDERVNFWCSDNIYARDLQRLGIEHALVRNSRVTHLGGRTLFTLPDPKIGEYTAGQIAIFQELL